MIVLDMVIAISHTVVVVVGYGRKSARKFNLTIVEPQVRLHTLYLEGVGR